MGNTLFTKLCQETTLFEAWKIVKLKNSAGGVDGTTIAQFEQNLVENIRALVTQLQERRWVPQPYLGIQIPKKDHEMRHLGMLSVGDKIVQCAIKLFINLIEQNGDESKERFCRCRV